MLKSRTEKQQMVNCPRCSVGHLPRNGDLTDGVYAFNCENCGHFVKFRAVVDVKSSLTFTVNGKSYTVDNGYDPSTTLLEFLRRSGASTGTKGSCLEGGCGVCLVTVQLTDPVTMAKAPYTLNSCLFPLNSCDGLEITTVEGLGSTRSGLHAIQDRLAKYDGAQCGFCTPGQIMNMNGILQRNSQPTMQEIEDGFDATICRCTGYRSILDAMKSFAKDAPHNLSGGMIDIEELGGKLCPTSGQACSGQCSNKKSGDNCHQRTDQSIHIIGNGIQWLKPTTMDELTKLLQRHRNDNYRLVFGNTGFGVYKQLSAKNYDILIDLRGVQAMYGIDDNPPIVLGANLSITSLIEFFQKKISDPSIPYAANFTQHLKKVAMHGIRNMAAWPGNLMLKHLHKEYPSDIFLMLETIGAKLIIYDGDNTNTQVSLPDFLNLDMKGKVIGGMTLPVFTSPNVKVLTYRTSLRFQACHSYVTAGFMMELDPAQNYKVIGKPSVVVMGINASTIHATRTETFLQGKQLGDPAVLKVAMVTLSGELTPDVNPLGGSPEFRKSLATGMFYKFVLATCKNSVNARYLSGGPELSRSLISGKREFDSDPSEFPVSKPMMKLTADYLTTGEVKFLDDLPSAPGTLCAAVVVSEVAKAEIDTVDIADALKVPGVDSIIQAKDLPAKIVNNWRPKPLYGDFEDELLSTGKINFAGQPIAVVLADSEGTAQYAAELVKVTYKNQQTPVTDLREAINKKRFAAHPPPPMKVGDATGAIASATNKVSGQISCGDQYHFHLETQTTISTPTDLGGMDIQASSQWIDGVLVTVAQVLGIPESAVTVKNMRLGGGFGGKITQNFLVSALTAVSAEISQKPVKLRLDIHTNMKMLGKRAPYSADYQVGFDANGKLAGVDITMYEDAGNCKTLSMIDNSIFIQDWFDNAYYCPNWNWTPLGVMTDKPANTACRSPGSVPFIFIMESIMEHVAKSLGKDPLEVRKLNLYQKGQKVPRGYVLNYCTIRDVVAKLETDIGLDQRKQAVETFNKANRWKKRGISVMPNRFGMYWTGAMYNTSVIIYHGDGSVAIAHGGIDMGQGINTKATQVCAYKLGITMDNIRVKPSSSTINPNSITTGGSITSELVCKGVIECCNQLNARLAPVRAKMPKPDYTWAELISMCYQMGVDLFASYMTNPTQENAAYSVYSAACVEAEVDILTGQYQLRQMDMLYDCGKSMNPELDMGQAEGGFMMGLGYFLQEKMIYDAQTGMPLNASTWEYKPPLAKDLPMNFNFTFQKNAPNPLGVLSSKAVGEPPVTMAAAGLFAIKHAMEAARSDAGNNNFFTLNAPATVDSIQELCLNTVDQFTFGN